MKSLTQLFNEYVGFSPLEKARDVVEYLDEREGIRMFDGEQDEATVVREAERDLERLEGRAPTPESLEFDF